MVKAYDIGDIVRSHGKFSTSTGSTTWTNPVTVYFHRENPTGTVTTGFITTPTTISTGTLKIHTLNTTSSGQFYVDTTATGSGRYNVRWFSTGTITSAGESGFNVRPQTVST